MTRAFTTVLAGLMVSSFALGVPEAKSWKIIRGDALHKLFANREFGDGVHFAYRFRAEGTFSGTEMAKDVRGTWRVVRDEMCWKWIHPTAAEECYRVQMNGTEIRLMRNGYEAWSGTLKP
jgi:hypothetical protein